MLMNCDNSNVGGRKENCASQGIMSENEEREDALSFKGTFCAW